MSQRSPPLQTQRKMPPPQGPLSSSVGGAAVGTGHHGRPPPMLRVGVLGCAKVLFKSWPAIHGAGHRVVCIGCRDPARAATVVAEVVAKIASAVGEDDKKASIPLPRIGSYEDVVRAADVDVYVTIPVALRGPWVQACIASGKHIVGEKPAAASAEQLLSWLEGCSVRRLLYMDGTMLTHSDRTGLVRDRVKRLGTLRHIEATFAFLASDSFLREDIRCRTDLEPHGALGDLGWYAIRWILHLVDYVLPTHVSGVITAVTPPTADGKAGGGAITAFEGHLTFPPPADAAAAPVTASFSCSFHAAYQQCVKVFTSGGLVEVQGAINPTGEDRPHYLVRTTAAPTAPGRRPAATATKVYSSAAEVDGSQQAVQMWHAVGASLMRLGVGEPLLLDPERGKDWGRNAYYTQLVVDRLLESATWSAAPQQ